MPLKHKRSRSHSSRGRRSRRRKRRDGHCRRCGGQRRDLRRHGAVAEGDNGRDGATAAVHGRRPMLASCRCPSASTCSSALTRMWHARRPIVTCNMMRTNVVSAASVATTRSNSLYAALPSLLRAINRSILGLMLFRLPSSSFSSK